MIQHGSSLSTALGALIVCAFIVAVVRAALFFTQGVEQGLEVRQKSDLQSLFSKEG